jgi:uncharacterized RDD family membrane protein YckC
MKLLKSDLKVPIVGLGKLSDRLVAFGLDPEEGDGTLVAAELDNDTWVRRRTLPAPAGKAVTVSAGRFGDDDVLVWQDEPTPKEKRERAWDLTLHIARIADNTLAPLPPLEFKGPVNLCGEGEGKTPLVYWRNGSPGVGLFGSDPDVIRRRVFDNGAWTELEPLHVPTGPFLRMRQAGVVEHEDRLFVYGCHYWFGLLYAGVYATELRDGRTSEKFAIRTLGPSEGEISDELTWVLQAIAATFVALGGVAGMVRLRRFEDQVTLMPDGPLYASVIERATAASFDFVLVFMVTWLAARQAGPFDFWIAFVFLFAMYGTMTEAVTQGQTLGKKLLGLRVLTTEGALPGFGPVLQRNALKFFEMLTVGVASCLVTRRFQRPGDLLAGTVVIKERVMPKPVGEAEK